MKYELLTSDMLFENGEASSVTLPCTDGELCVMDNHLPLAAALKEGTLKIKSGAGTKCYRISGGAAYVKGNVLTVFTDVMER